MPFNNITGIYTPPTGAENAAPGQVIRSATWNSIFTDIATSFRAAGFLCNTVVNVNFNQATTDTTIPVTLPAGYSNYQMNLAIISNASGSLTSATAGLFTGPGATGQTIIALTSLTVTSGLANTNNNAQALGASTTEVFNSGTLYFRVGTPQGTAATATVTLYVRPAS